MRYRLAALIFILWAGSVVAQVMPSGGPSILSRQPSLRTGPADALFTIRPSASIVGRYDHGLFLPATDAEGRLLGQDSYGIAAILGLDGFHQTRDSVVSLDYRGQFRHYTENDYLDGSDHALSLGYEHRLTNRTLVAGTAFGGLYSRSFGVPGLGRMSPPIVDIGPEIIPTNEIFDSRVYYAGAGANIVHQKSMRLSFGAGANGFTVHRRSRSLAGVIGASAQGNVAYRLSRRQTIGADYTFTKFDFTKGFGLSDMHIVSLNYAAQLTRHWTFSTRAGIFRFENLRVVTVQLDPVIAEILGRKTGLETHHQVNYGPIVRAVLTREFQRGSFSASYSRIVSPGNGIYLSSIAESGRVGYNYRGSRRWNSGVAAGVTQYGALTQTIGKYHSYYGSAQTSYRLKRFLHLTSSFIVRSHRIGEGSDFKRTSYSASIGLAFAPGEIPLSLN